jgi:hypothetical protein
MKKMSLPLLLLLCFFSCKDDHQKNNPAFGAGTTNVSPSATLGAAAEVPFTVDKAQAATLSFGNLRLYPIIATPEHIAAHVRLARLKNLKEAIGMNGFHITEKKPYGRFDDMGAVNSLTVQNKTQDTIYLMAGDVVQGGNQDRLLAEDMIVPPRTITDIKVFCAEPNRWEARPNVNSNPSPQSQQKQYAFTGYYNVASNEIRKIAKQSGDQQAIWDKIGEWTAHHDAVSPTGAYAALEDAEAFTSNRDQYLDFFNKQMKLPDHTIGIIAVSGDKVLGADIFNHPTLFNKQFPSLLHAYVTDVITYGKAVNIEEDALDKFIKKMDLNYSESLSEQIDRENKFSYGGLMVHFSYLP